MIPKLVVQGEEVENFEAIAIEAITILDSCIRGRPWEDHTLITSL